MTKFLCLSFLTLIGPSLAGVAAARQAWPSEFSSQATTILGHLLSAFKKKPTGVRLSYAAQCDAVRRAPLIPPIRLQRPSRDNTVLEAARSTFSGNDNINVSSDEQNNVSIEIGNAPDTLLRTKIAALRLNEIEQYNPLRAIPAIEATKEVRKAATALHLISAPSVSVQLVQPTSPGAPHLPSVLHNLTVDQILGMLAARFKGAVLYGVCTNGAQPHEFSIDFFDSDLWS